MSVAHLKFAMAHFGYVALGWETLPYSIVTDPLWSGDPQLRTTAVEDRV